MLKKLVITSALASSVALTAHAAIPANLYVSGQVGYADTNLKSRLKYDGLSLANNGLAGRIAIGYKLANNVALELGYLQLPSATTSHSDTQLTTKQNAIDVAAKGMLPITNNVNIYGKLGAAYLTTLLDKKYTSEQGIPITNNQNSTIGIAKHQWAPEVAIGMGYNITQNATVDTSFTHIQPLGSNRPGNINLLAVGFAYNFG